MDTEQKKRLGWIGLYEEMLKERGFEVDHATIHRWVLGSLA